MAVKDHPSDAVYRNFLNNGGTVTSLIEPEDIDVTRAFETSTIIKPQLKTGFELTPPGGFDAPQNAAMIIAYGGAWINVIRQVYSRGGKIIYKQLQPNLYEAVSSIPHQPTAPTSVASTP
jgi:hypothetical protein